MEELRQQKRRKKQRKKLRYKAAKFILRQVPTFCNYLHLALLDQGRILQLGVIIIWDIEQKSYIINLRNLF